jgi:hypothetical protein
MAIHRFENRDAAANYPVDVEIYFREFFGRHLTLLLWILVGIDLGQQQFQSLQDVPEQ